MLKNCVENIILSYLDFINRWTNLFKLVNWYLHTNDLIIQDHKKIGCLNRIIGEYIIAKDILKKLG